MKTSYFRNIGKVKNPISIALKNPYWYEASEYKKLAPTFSLLYDFKSKKINESDYTVRYYYTILDKLKAKEVFEELCGIYNTEDFTLLCYEEPNEFCHRHIVSDWFRRNGIDCEEL